MSEDADRKRLDIEAIVVGYAMSRLDQVYLGARGVQTWQAAYGEAASALGNPSSSFKNLRDEFDPIHPNARRGWHRDDSPLRQSRQRVLDELCDVSDDALSELIDRILARDESAVAEAMDSLAVTTRVAANVAERLLTGRRAEEYFIAHSEQIMGVPTLHILDYRISAQGYDFGVQSKPETAIEVKGLKHARGSIQFTDREWMEAKHRRENYWLAVIGDLASIPIARIFRDPYTALPARCSYQTSVVAVWRSSVSLSEGAGDGRL